MMAQPVEVLPSKSKSLICKPVTDCVKFKAKVCVSALVGFGVELKD